MKKLERKWKKVATVLLVLFTVISICGVNFGSAKKEPLEVIGIFDSSQFMAHSTRIADRLSDSLKAQGYKVITILPQQAVDPQQINRSRLDALVYIGSDHTVPIGKLVLDYLKQGGRLWLIVDKAPFTGTEFTTKPRTNGTEFIVATENPPSHATGGDNPNVGTGMEHLSLTLATEIQRYYYEAWKSFSPDKIIEPPVATVDGLSYFPTSIDAYCKAALQGDVKLLSLASTAFPRLRPSCKFLGMAKTKFRYPIWAGGRPDTSAGFPLVMIVDRCAEFGGSQTLYADLSAMERLSKSDTDWQAFVREAVEALVDDDLTAIAAPKTAILDQGQRSEIQLRLDNYAARERAVAVRVEAVRKGSDKGIELVKIKANLKPRGQKEQTISFDTDTLGEGLYDLVVYVDGEVYHKHLFSVLPGPSVPLSRQDLWDNPHAGRFVIMFRNYDQRPNNTQYAVETGLQGFSLHMPWVPEGETIETMINWEALDRWVEDSSANGMKLMLDAWDHRYFPKYFVHVEHPEGAWRKYMSVVVNENHKRWAAFWGEVAKRYNSSDNVLAMFLTPGQASTFVIDVSEAASADFATYLRDVKGVGLDELAEKYQIELANWGDIRTPDTANPAGDMIARILDYYDFWKHQHYLFLEESAKTIRANAPQMGLMFRGNYETCPRFIHLGKLSETYGPISINTENVETTLNSHTWMYGNLLRYGLAIQAENGWPSCQGEPSRHAFFKALMGHYNSYLWSGGSAIQLIPNRDYFTEYAYLDATLKQTKDVQQKAFGVLAENQTTEVIRYSGLKLKDEWLWSGHRLFWSLFFLGYTSKSAVNVNTEYPDLSGLDVILDGGDNMIIRDSALAKIMQWVAQGNTLVIYDKFDIINHAGIRGVPLAKRLRDPEKYNCGGIPAKKIGKAKPFLTIASENIAESISVGKGKVIVLNELRADQKLFNTVIEAVLDKLKVDERPVVCDRPIPLTVREDENSMYVILYDLDTHTRYGYFYYDDIQDDTKVSDIMLDLTLTVPFKPTAATNMVSNERLQVSGKKVQFKLRKSHGMVIRIDKP